MRTDCKSKSDALENTQLGLDVCGVAQFAREQKDSGVDAPDGCLSLTVSSSDDRVTFLRLPSKLTAVMPHSRNSETHLP